MILSVITFVTPSKNVAVWERDNACYTVRERRDFERDNVYYAVGNVTV